MTTPAGVAGVAAVVAVLEPPAKVGIVVAMPSAAAPIDEITYLPKSEWWFFAFDKLRFLFVVNTLHIRNSTKNPPASRGVGQKNPSPAADAKFTVRRCLSGRKTPRLCAGHFRCCFFFIQHSPRLGSALNGVQALAVDRHKLSIVM